ncbi:MAG: Gfo/Idh/MocA family oxidoreductase [Bryobacterales bacterium]|nr:Gfo/Idh/MocA family oxidoreductase [Bryobacterales bacterium]
MHPKTFLCLAAVSALALSAADLRLGIIGTDTSHVIAFSKVLNDPSSADHISGAKIVAAYKGGSPDIDSSKNRVDGYAKDLAEKFGVEIVPDIKTLVSKVDAILLESVDGRKHLPQFKEIAATGKKLKVFIDKPLAATLADAREIDRVAKQAGIQWFSTSSLRWSEIATTMKSPAAKTVMTWGPGPEEKTHYLDLSWYAIHPVEMLFTLMGTGCTEVSRTSSADGDVVVGKWSDGRIGMVRTGKPYSDYGAVVFGGKVTAQSHNKMKMGYTPMLGEIIKFFQGGPVPVPNAETLEIFAFMDAAQKSKEQGGRPVKLAK